MWLKLIANKYVVGAAGLLLALAAVWGYGQYQYTLGADAAKLKAERAANAIQEAMQYDKDKADAAYRGAVLAREAAQKNVSAQRDRINGLLYQLRVAKTAGSGGGSDGAGNDGIGVLISCIAEYDAMGNDAARLADKVGGLQSYIRAVQTKK